MGFMFQVHKGFWSTKLYTLCRGNETFFGILLIIMIWAFTSNLLNSIQCRAVRLAGNKALAAITQSLAHRDAVGYLFLYCRYFHRLCTNEHTSIIPHYLCQLDQLEAPPSLIVFLTPWKKTQDHLVCATFQSKKV